jgi:cytochrome b6-f complex iron-sulfur subunit
MRKPEDRVDRIVSVLLRGGRLKLGAGDIDEKAAIITAARLAATRGGPAHMRPAFRRHLADTLEPKPRERLVTRRSALVAGLGLAAGMATGGLVAQMSRPRQMGPASGALIEPLDGRWIDVAAMSELEEGVPKRVLAGSVSAYVFRHGASVTAVSSICSHLPCELVWNGGSRLLSCPCHTATFFPDGRSTDRRYPLPALSRLSVEVTSSGRVLLLGTARGP